LRLVTQQMRVLARKALMTMIARTMRTMAMNDE
jgi:hypothetical protein